MEPLSSLDASFLYLETPETPMHTAALMIVDPPAAHRDDYYEAFKAMVGERLHLAPVLTRKLALMPFDLADPVWIEDDDIDLDYHVRYLVLPRPGSRRQLDLQVARLHSQLLDRSRPLWEMYVIEGLQGGQVAIYLKGHHSGFDGKSGLQMAQVLFDVTPQVRKVTPARRRHRKQGYQLGVAELLQAAVRNTARQYRKLAELAPAAARAWSAASLVLASQGATLGDRPLVLGLAPRTPFNVPITNQRSFSYLSVPFDEVKALGKRLGVTINTIVMTMCSIALGRYLKQRGALPRQPLIAAVPVSLRAADDSAMNNQVSMVRIDMATDIADLAQRLHAVHASAGAAKAMVHALRPVLGIDLTTTGAPWILSSMASFYGRSNLPRELPPLANATISNMPGPDRPLYICGGAVQAMYPISIPTHASALNITVHSYARRQFEFGIVSCPRVVSQDEAYELAGYLKDALVQLGQLPGVVAPEGSPRPRAAGARKARRPTARPAPRRAAARRLIPHPAARLPPPRLNRRSRPPPP